MITNDDNKFGMSSSRIGIKNNTLNIDNKNNNQKDKIKINKEKDIIKKKMNTNIYKDYNDYELNILPYKEALKIDKRTYIQYYFSLIKRKQTLVFTFYTKKDYNSRCIKICIFSFFLALSYTINAFFFNDSTIHNIFTNQGEYNFVYQIPKIIYSALISSAFNIIIISLSLSEKI